MKIDANKLIVFAVTAAVGAGLMYVYLKNKEKTATVTATTPGSVTATDNA